MSNYIEEIKSGNKDAVKAIYQEYAKDVYNFSKSITGDHDSALAATKKTFGKLINNIKRGDEPKDVRTALLKIAYDEACKIAMPSVSNESNTESEPVPAPVEEKKEPRKVRPVRATKPVNIEEETAAPAREEIYMPKGGYDSLQVEENVEEVPEEVVERPRRRRPEGEAAPRKRRPVSEGEEAPRRRKPIMEEETPVVLPVADEEDFIEEEYEAPKPKRKARPIREEEPVDVYDALDEESDYDDSYDDDDYVEEKPRNKGLFLFCIILNIILILILLWFLGGLLVNLGVLPQMDLGYIWFNNHIYPLF